MLTTVARAENIEDLMQFIAREKAPEVYQEDGFCKIFRKNGPLEWYNYPWNDNESFVDIGTLEDWIAATKSNWEDMLQTIPEIESAVYREYQSLKGGLLNCAFSYFSNDINKLKNYLQKALKFAENIPIYSYDSKWKGTPYGDNIKRKKT